MLFLSARVRVDTALGGGAVLATGVVLAGAVGSKVSFAFAPVAFVAFSLVRQWRERDSPYWRVELLPLIAGGIVGALPMAVVALPSLENF